MKIINKIAFLVHEPTMYTHYSGAWAEMDRNCFVIVLLGLFKRNSKGEYGVKEFLNKVEKLGYEIVYLEDIVANKTKYQYAVSNHILGGISQNSASWYQALQHKAKNTIKQSINLYCRLSGATNRYQVNRLDPVQYPPLQAGIKQIRFMYGADISDAWSLDAWNDIYDLFLCHGPNDEMHLKKRFKGKTAIMGYPRYDGYFSHNLNVDDVIAEFAIDRTKQTILWMPTMDPFGDKVCSIPFFAKAISSLADEFNVIVRPHPITFRVDPDAIKLLESLRFSIDRESTRDMNKMFKVADAVLCDHGGSAFGALYLDKKLIFLSTPHEKDAVVVENSSNLELLQNYPVVGAHEVESIQQLLKDDAYWQACLAGGRALSGKYFADYRGCSSQIAAQILSNLDHILA